MEIDHLQTEKHSLIDDIILYGRSLLVSDDMGAVRAAFLKKDIEEVRAIRNDLMGMLREEDEWV